MWEACGSVFDGMDRICGDYGKVCTDIPDYDEVCVYYDSKPDPFKAYEDVAKKIADEYNGKSVYNGQVKLSEASGWSSFFATLFGNVSDRTRPPYASTRKCEVQYLGFGCTVMESCITYCKPMM